MTKEKVIQTLIDDYSKQAKLSKRERTIFEHGLLTGIEIGPMEEPEVDLEKEFYEEGPEEDQRDRENRRWLFRGSPRRI